MRFQTFCALVFSTVYSLAAQAQNHVLKLELTRLAARDFSFRYERTLCDQRSIELSAGWQTYSLAPSDILFNGQWTTHFAEQMTTQTRWTNGIPQVVSSETALLGTGRPLPDLRSFVPVLTVPVRAGLRHKMPFKRSKTCLFAQAGLAAMFHSFYKIETATHIVSQQEERTRRNFPDPTERLVRTTRFEQTRRMSLQSRWLAGCTFDVGWLWQPCRLFRLEGRMAVGLNTRLPYVDVPNPILKPMYIRPQITIGVGF